MTSLVRLLAIVARIARPSAPPICWAVLTSPDARPASCGRVPVTAAIVTGTKDRPRPIAASSEGPSTSAGERAARSGHAREPEEACGDEQQPHEQHRLEAKARDGHRRRARRQDDRNGQRQIGEPGPERRVMQYLLHVQRDEEEHREQRHADQQRHGVGAAKRAQPEDRERHQRRARAQLDRQKVASSTIAPAINSSVSDDPQPALTALTSA